MAWLTAIDPNRLNAYAALAAAAVALVALIAPLLWRVLSSPRLDVDFENRRRWRRHGQSGQVLSLYFRVRVTNTGWRSAVAVTGVLAELLDASGNPVLEIDPFILKWAGSPQQAGPGGIVLLPRQSEYVDVFRVNWNMAAGQGMPDGLHSFELIPKDPTPRALQLQFPIAGQTIRVLVLSDNARGSGLEFQLPPTAPPFAVNTLSVKHRPVDRFGLSLEPWSEEPPPRLVSGISVASAEP